MVNDLISDMISTIKNGLNAKKLSIKVNYSKICLKILDILYTEGYISGYRLVESFKIEVFLKYKDNQGVINEIQRISKLSKRIYISNKSLKRNYFPGVLLIISTGEGLLTNREILLTNRQLGGELLLKIL